MKITRIEAVVIVNGFEKYISINIDNGKLANPSVLEGSSADELEAIARILRLAEKVQL